MKEIPLIDWLKKYWFLIVFAGAMVMGWTNIQNSIQDLNRRQTSIESKVEIQTFNQNQIQVQLSQIQTDLSWVKQRLSN